MEPEKYEPAPVELARDRGVVEGVYRYLDSFLGELLAELDDNTWLIVASDHGADRPLALRTRTLIGARVDDIHRRRRAYFSCGVPT